MNAKASSTSLLVVLCFSAAACQTTRAVSPDGAPGDTAPAVDRGDGHSSKDSRGEGPTALSWKWHANFPVDLTRVWGTAADDVYAIGSGRGGPIYPAILHFDGTQWARVNVPRFTTPSVYGLYSIWGTSSNDLFVADGGDGHSTLLHFDGALWRVVETTPTMYIHELSGLGTKDLFVAGIREPDGVVFRYDRTTWTELPFDFRLPSVDSPVRIWRMWGTSPSDIFVNGGFSVPQGNESPSVLLHYNGKAWNAIGTFPSQTSVVAIWGTGPSDVYASVSRNETTSAALYHYDGLQLSLVDIPLRADDGIADIWSTSGGELFAVGRSIYHRTASGWTITPIPEGGQDVQALIGVWGAESGDVWAIAGGGDIYHYGK